MRSLWALLILLSICSYFAQRKWASLFDNDVLQALLQLPGYKDSRLVRAADSARPYEMLALLSSDLEVELNDKMMDPKVVELPRNEQVSHKIDIVDNYVNVYDHKLDYYPNQLTYLLLTKNAAAYKLSCLKLRRKLIIYSIYSTYFTLMQFILPLIFIGSEYLSYGWKFFVAFIKYILKLLTSNKPILDNSIDYELSSSIFPISTQCEYQQYGMAGEIEKVTVQCTVAINEICGKLFVAIWWFVVINIIIEFWSLFTLLVCSINFSTIRWTFGLRYWPHARKQADLIASFRYRRSVLLNNKNKFKTIRPISAGNKQINQTNGHLATDKSVDLSDHEKKRLEAEGDNSPRSRTGSMSKRWYHWCMQDVCMPVAGATIRFICCCTNRRRQFLEREAEKDINVYYILYLIYLRLGKSKSRIEEVIKMTSGVLCTYLDDLQTHEDEVSCPPVEKFDKPGKGEELGTQLEKPDDAIVDVMM